MPTLDRLWRRGRRSGEETTTAPAPPTLQSRLQAGYQSHADSVRTANDPAALIAALEITEELQRDRRIGRIFHPGKLSFRERRPGNSLHISVEENLLLAHVDLVSPLKLEADRGSRYSLLRIASHNFTGMAGDVVRLLRGRQGDHRCEIDCEWSPTGDDEGPRAIDDGSNQSAPTGPTVRPATLRGTPGPPRNVQVEIGVTGHLDEERLRQAWCQVLAQRGGDGDDFLTVADGHDDQAVESARLELQRQLPPLGWPPLNVCLVRRPNGDLVMVNFHYAVADGFGTMQMLRFVARAYTGVEPPAGPVDLLALHAVPIRPATGDTRAVWLYRSAIERVRNLLTPPSLLAADRQGERTGFGYHLERLSEDDTRTFVHFDHAGTSTDVLLTALHQAIAEWNVGHGRTGGRISVLVSANLRSPKLPTASVGNFSVTARVSTSRRDRSDPTATLHAVTSQTGRNRRSRTGVALLEALHRLGLLALWARQSVIVLEPVSVNRSVDSAMLSNLGRLVDPPNFSGDAGTTTEAWFSPPTRIPVGLTIGAATVSGSLHLVFRYPRRLFDDDAAKRFAACYLEQLRRVAP